MTKNLKNILKKLQFLFVSHLKDFRDPKKKMLQESLLKVRKGSCDKCNTCLNFFPHALYTYIKITNNTQIYTNDKTTKLPQNNNFVQPKYQKLQKNHEKLI